jgi:hypothetical protein
LFLAVVGVVLLIAGLTALLTGQPYGVWYGLMLPGVPGVISLTWAPRVIRNGYRQAEERRMAARDVSL